MNNKLKRRRFLQLLGLVPIATPGWAQTLALPEPPPVPAAATVGSTTTLALVASGGDDTAAIRVALAVPGVRLVEAAPGTYTCSDEIVIPAGVTFECQEAVFQFTNLAKNGFVLRVDSRLRHAHIQSIASAETDDRTRAFEACNGVLMFNADRAEVRGCTISGWQHSGIFERDCHDFIIADNVIHSNRFVHGTSADILAWSWTTHYGGRVTGNSCFSNNSQGIYVVSGTDEEIVIAGNRCIALDGLTAAMPSPLRRRHGIMVGYDGARRRALVSGNTIRRTTQTGICCQANKPVTGSIHIVNNIISDTGRLVGATNGVISAIAMLVQGEGDLISGNQIDNHVYAGGGAAGIGVLPGVAAVSEHASTRVMANTVTNVAGAGIMAISRAQNVTISDNAVSSCGGGIVLRPDIARAYADTMTASGNRVTMPVGSTQAAVVVNNGNAAGSLTRFVVDGNVLKGQNKAAYEPTNAGVFINGQAGFDAVDGAIVAVTGNSIEGFALGVATGFYLMTAVRNVSIANNRLTDCLVGLAIAGGGGAGGRLIATGNKYKACTRAVGSGPNKGPLAVWEGQLANGVATVLAEAPPSTGGWSAGDQVIRLPPQVGQPKGWRCIDSGIPGTWVSDGNL